MWTVVPTCRSSTPTLRTIRYVMLLRGGPPVPAHDLFCTLCGSKGVATKMGFIVPQKQQ